MKKVLLVLLLLWPGLVRAQTVSGDQFVLNTGPCQESSGSGVPNGSVTGRVCDTYHDTGGLWWVKITGTGNTGWISWASANTASFLVARDGSGGFSMGALLATNVTNSALTAGRVTFAGASGLLSDNANLTFSTDTLTVTKAIVPTSVTTPVVYAYGTTPSPLTLGGSGVSGCNSPPTAAGCEGMTNTWTTAFQEQRLITDATQRSAWYVGIDGGAGALTPSTHLTAYNSNGFTALRLAGSPTQIDGGGFHVGSTSITDPGLGNTALDGYIGVPGYVSRTTGWRVTSDGSADFQLITANELVVKTFTADLEQALAGGQIIAKSVAPLAADFLVPSKGSVATLTVKDFDSAPAMAVFVSGDTIRIRTLSRANGGLLVADAWGTVTSYTNNGDKTQNWSFTRLLGANGGNIPDASVTVPAASLVLDYGVTGNGYIENTAIDGTATVVTLTRVTTTATATTSAPHGLQTGDTATVGGADQSAYNGSFVVTVTSSTVFTYTVSGTPTTPATGNILVNGSNGTNAPYSQIVTWAGSSPIPPNLTLRTRFGNLRGVTGTAEYGLLAGTYGATSAGKYIIFSDQHAEIHNVPLSLYNGANLTLYLNPVTSSFGQATSGADTQTFSTGTGCWSGVDAGVFKWRCGDMTGGTQYISWNGTQLTVAGNIVVTGTSIDASSVLGVAGATVNSGAARGLLGIDANGLPSLPHVATPTGSGLFLGSDYLGYYTSGAWKTYMNSSGQFYLGGTSGALQWDGTTLTITGVINITGTGNALKKDLSNATGNYAASASVGGSASTLSGQGALATQNTAAWTTDVSGRPAELTDGRIAAALSSAGKFLNPVPAAPSGAGLWLGSDYLGYYNGSAWRTYMDSSGNFYLGGAAGSLQWNGSTLTINGSGAFTGTLSAAAGAVTIDASGITIINGVGAQNELKWNDSSAVYSSFGQLILQSGNQLRLSPNAGAGPDVVVKTNDVTPTTPIKLGTATNPWSEIHANGVATFTAAVGANGTPLVINTDTGPRAVVLGLPNAVVVGYRALFVAN